MGMYGSMKKSENPKPRVGERILEGLDEAIAWSKGAKTGARITEVAVAPPMAVRDAPL